MPYLTPEQLRARWPILAGDGTLVSDDVLAQKVAAFEDLAERYRGIAYLPRPGTIWEQTFTRRRPTRLFLPHVEVTAVTAVTIDGIDLAAGDLARIRVARNGTVTLPGGWWGEVVVTYTHGLAEPPVLALEACAKYVRFKAIDHARTEGPSNAISFTDPGSGIVTRESTASWVDGRPTGIKEVDDDLNALVDHRMELVR